MKHIIKAFFSVIMCFLMLTGFSVCAVGREYDASVVFKDGYNCFSGIIEGSLRIFVADDVYNENVKLSYHIKDAEGNMLAFENERISLKGMGFPSEVYVKIDLNDFFAKTNGGSLTVLFDLVDEENIYWFSDNPERNCDFEQLTIDSTGSVSEKSYASTVIMHDAAPVIYDNDLIINAEVYFGSPELYNESVKLSYKIYDADNNEVVSGENERYELAYDGEKGTAQIQLHLSDLGKYSKKELKICFDLVDEKNVYWFGDSPEIELQFTPVIYKYDFVYNVKKQYLFILSHQYIQLIINIAGIIFAAAMFIKLRSKLKSN